MAKRRPERIVLHAIACEICGNTFEMTGKEHNRSQRRTCSDRCERVLRSQAYQPHSLDTPEAREHFVAARRQHEHMRPDANNCAAKAWRLVAPDGTVYQFVNLMHFLREHTELFAENDLLPQHGSCRAYQQLSRLRPGRVGRKKSWKDWRWDGD